MVDLTVVIVSYNVSYFLEQCLHSVLKASGKLTCEVIVVDNNSVDGSVALVRQKFPTVKLIANKENVGFSKANNQAIRESTGEYVLLLNPDTLVEEDTFAKTVAFMNEHPDAGGLGLKMIDGKGQFLAESKRGLPTPSVAFYKIFGLSALFPKSKAFGKYHLGYLSKEETHSIDVLSGAFMLMRKSVLDKIGLLDEDFFMYGEDIDLSYRIILGGYKNYYFHDARIIHYKGESTKKSSVNYVFVFYRAMVIFAKKHFSKRNAKTFSFFINLAIYIRAGLAIIQRFISSIFIYLADLSIILALLLLLKAWYVSVSGITYQTELLIAAFTAYTSIWMISCFLNGGYDRPYSKFKNLRGIAIGTLIILMVYALLPESLRFSRALILLGTFTTTAYFLLSRSLLNSMSPSEAQLREGKIGVIASEKEFDRIEKLLSESGFRGNKPLRISPEKDKRGEEAHADRLTEIVSIYKLQTVIFSGLDVASQRIIGLMANTESKRLQFKIAPPESAFIIGSNSIERGGNVFLMDLNAVNKASNKRRKRSLDFVLALVFLFSYLIIVWGVQEKVGFFRNILSVIGGQKSWVGYAKTRATQPDLPQIRTGVLNPMDRIRFLKTPEETAKKLNAVYAREYGLRKDLAIVSSGFSSLGRRDA
ncbi:MAG: GT2 family glycosyltransferase [Gammaproteobacteria bacterium]|jgi:GT2 family glycosyltransferase